MLHKYINLLSSSEEVCLKHTHTPPCVTKAAKYASSRFVFNIERCKSMFCMQKWESFEPVLAVTVDIGINMCNSLPLWRRRKRNKRHEGISTDYIGARREGMSPSLVWRPEKVPLRLYPSYGFECYMKDHSYMEAWSQQGSYARRSTWKNHWS